MYAKPGPAYFVVDSSMFGKMPSISYLGNWDLARVYIARNTYKKTRTQMIEYLVDKMGMDKEQADSLCQEASLIPHGELPRWISRKYGFYGQPVRGQLEGDLILFDNGSVYNPVKNTFYSYSVNESKYKIPNRIFIAKGRELIEKVYSEGEQDYSVLIQENASGFQLLTMAPDLVKSMFVRLNFLKGAGTKYFEPFTEETDGAEHIGVFKIKWD
jgi:hypothetical protein